MIQLSKSSATMLLAVHANKLKSKKSTKSDVKVGSIGLSKPSTVGNAENKYLKHLINITKVGATKDVAPGSPDKPSLGAADLNPQPASESKQIATKVIDKIGRTTAIIAASTLVVGPPVIGYILFQGTGLFVGSMIAGPFVLVLAWTILA